MSTVLESSRNEIADGVLTLCLNRPDQRNSLNQELMSAITAAIAAATALGSGEQRFLVLPR